MNEFRTEQFDEDEQQTRAGLRPAGDVRHDTLDAETLAAWSEDQWDEYCRGLFGKVFEEKPPEGK